MKNPKNKILISFILITTFITNHATDLVWIEEESVNRIAPFTHTVLNHYYIIERLKKAVTLLKTVPQDIIRLLPFEQLPASNHNQIIACINQLKKEKTIKAIFTLWKKIITYKLATDNQCITEFTALIFILLAMIKQEGISCDNALKQYCVPPIPPTNTSAIAFRFFLLRRLHKTHLLLKQCKNCLPKTKKINSALNLFDMFYHYHAIDKPTFIKNFLQLIFITTQTIALNTETATTQHRNLLNLENYNELPDDCTIEEILSAIDDATIHASMLIAHHSKKNILTLFKKLMITLNSTANNVVTHIANYL